MDWGLAIAIGIWGPVYLGVLVWIILQMIRGLWD